jgi:hypothetical protein
MRHLRILVVILGAGENLVPAWEVETRAQTQHQGMALAVDVVEMARELKVVALVPILGLASPLLVLPSTRGRQSLRRPSSYLQELFREKARPYLCLLVEHPSSYPNKAPILPSPLCRCR